MVNIDNKFLSFFPPLLTSFHSNEVEITSEIIFTSRMIKSINYWYQLIIVVNGAPAGYF